ncbi:GNAT family N-acetyltransferase [Labedella endophytica]|uniref:N-acetyltransferase n=1 Tax=Labedella endophytica TaxID=1523160 RepID=A0A3S1CQQ5_9MICO|nr:GNAT family N-acetyltransferase [Labedella endophytica]RUQ99188.1 N-acetyltransferase [Labedella endophytica]
MIEGDGGIAETRVTLERIEPDQALRIIARDEAPGDSWEAEYPLEDELDPLRCLAASTHPHPVFTLYMIRRVSDGRAIGGFGFFGPPDEEGRVEFGYGLVPSARGIGLATEAVLLGLERARDAGARIAVAETERENHASRRVLSKAGFTEVAREGSLVLYSRDLRRA